MKNLTKDQLLTNKRKAQLRLAEIIPTGGEALRLSAEISTIDRILNALDRGETPTQALLKKQIIGKAQREYIKKPDSHV